MGVFEHSLLVDETYLQTILYDYKPDHFEDSDIKLAARYIDWKIGRPYIFTMADVPKSKSKVNTQYAFAQKVEIPLIVNAVFERS